MPTLGRLHLITDGRPGHDPLALLRAVRPHAGPDLVIQVRVAESTTDREAYALATRVVALYAGTGATCLVNDRLHVALAAGAAGGHVGADDLPVAVARRLLGPDAVLGATARTPADAVAAVAAGADYVGVGPCFATDTKPGLPAPIGPDGVRRVAGTVGVPVIAIGGVTLAAVPDLRTAGAHGVAVISAVSAAADPAGAVADLLGVLR
nr:thiamine phosphate synthase [Micromonospora sp. DSM 115978]